MVALHYGRHKYTLKILVVENFMEWVLHIDVEVFKHLTDITQTSLIRVFEPNWDIFQSSILDLESDKFELSYCKTVLER